MDLKFGIIELVGAPLDLYRDSDNKFVAGFVGSSAMNFVKGTVRGDVIDVPAFGGNAQADIVMPADGTGVIAGLRPEHASPDRSRETLMAEMTEALGACRLSI